MAGGILEVQPNSVTFCDTVRSEDLDEAKAKKALKMPRLTWCNWFSEVSTRGRNTGPYGRLAKIKVVNALIGADQQRAERGEPVFFYRIRFGPSGKVSSHLTIRL